MLATKEQEPTGLKGRDHPIALPPATNLVAQTRTNDLVATDYRPIPIATEEADQGYRDCQEADPLAIWFFVASVVAIIACCLVVATEVRKIAAERGTNHQAVHTQPQHNSGQQTLQPRTNEQPTPQGVAIAGTVLAIGLAIAGRAKSGHAADNNPPQSNPTYRCNPHHSVKVKVEVEVE